MLVLDEAVSGARRLGAGAGAQSAEGPCRTNSAWPTSSSATTSRRALHGRRVLVMKDGRVVEQGETRALLAALRQDYARRLLAAVLRGLAGRAERTGPMNERFPASTFLGPVGRIHPPMRTGPACDHWPSAISQGSFHETAGPTGLPPLPLAWPWRRGRCPRRRTMRRCSPAPADALLTPCGNLSETSQAQAVARMRELLPHSAVTVAT